MNKNMNFLRKVFEKIKQTTSILKLNEFFFTKFGFVQFFKSENSRTEFLLFLENRLTNQAEIQFKNNDLGDFQTPKEFSYFVTQKNKNDAEVLIEPTCGIGHFVISAIETMPSLKYIYCIELQPKYEWIFKTNLLTLFENN